MDNTQKRMKHAPGVSQKSGPGDSLWLEETTILSGGVLVGELIFTNTGDETCRFGGEIVKLNKQRRRHRRTVQWVQLAPGEETRHPVCLMKFNSAYIFEEIGSYRIRAVFRNGGLADVNMMTGEVSQEEKPFIAKSEWVDFVVTPAGKGRANYVNSHPQDNIYAAFRSSRVAVTNWKKCHRITITGMSRKNL